MSILSLIATSNYITVNRTIASLVGLEAAVVLGELASEAAYWSEHNPEYDGSFYSTIENLEKRTYLSAHSQRLALNKLQEQGWVTVEKRGMPAKRFIRIHEEEIERVVNNKSLKILTTSDQKNERQVVKNLNTNKNINKENIKEEISEEIEEPEVINDYDEYEFQNRPATNKDIEKIVDLITNAFPYIKKTTNKKELYQVWKMAFKGTNGKVLFEAIKTYINTNKYFPKIEEIKQQIKRQEYIGEINQQEEPAAEAPGITEDLLKIFQEN